MTVPAASFDTYAAYRTAVQEAIANASQTLLILDHDLSETGLESPATSEKLQQLLMNSVIPDCTRILLRNTARLEHFMPRTMNLVARFSHRLSVRSVPDNTPFPDSPFIVADGHLLVVRFYYDQARGKAGSNLEDAEIYTDRFESLWVSSSPGPTGTTMGL